MPLIQKPRDSNYGVRKVLKRKVVRRKRANAFILPETMKYIAAQHETMSPGQVVDAAIKLYAKQRELSEVSIKERETTKLQELNTTVSQETIAYFLFMRGVMTPGELIDVAIILCRKLAKDSQQNEWKNLELH